MVHLYEFVVSILDIVTYCIKLSFVKWNKKTWTTENLVQFLVILRLYPKILVAWSIILHKMTFTLRQILHWFMFFRSLCSLVLLMKLGVLSFHTGYLWNWQIVFFFCLLDLLQILRKCDVLERMDSFLRNYYHEEDLYLDPFVSIC